MLAENNLVVKMSHRGYTVKQPDMDEISELYDVRLALELFTVKRLTKQGMTQSYWDNLHQTWSTLLDHLPSTDVNLASRDEEFHETLAEATGNMTLLDLLRTVDERLRFVRLTDFSTVERRRETCQQHLQILECITARDAAAAQEAMRQNIELGRMNVEAAVKEVLAKAYMKYSANP
jgi:DNA-binding GntR family transcriptional regulator